MYLEALLQDVYIFNVFLSRPPYAPYIIPRYNGEAEESVSWTSCGTVLGQSCLNELHDCREHYCGIIGGSKGEGGGGGGKIPPSLSLPSVNQYTARSANLYENRPKQSQNVFQFTIQFQETCACNICIQVTDKH